MHVVNFAHLETFEITLPRLNVLIYIGHKSPNSGNITFIDCNSQSFIMLFIRILSFMTLCQHAQ